MEIPGIQFASLVQEAQTRFCAPYKLFRATGASPRLPKIITLESTSACQLACKMCDRTHLQREQLLMPDDVFQTIVAKIAPHPIRINFNGIGEPLLDKKMVERIAYVRAAGVKKVSMITNGLLLTPALGESLIRAGLKRIAISMDSIDQQSLEAVHDGSNYATLARNLEALLATREAMNAKDFKIVIRLTVQQENLAGIPDVYRQWHGRVDEIRVNFVYQYGNIETHPVTPYAWNEPVPCPNMLDTMLVLTNGAATICCLGDVNAELNTGNLVTDSLEHCFSGPIAREVREKHLAMQLESLPVCQRCSAATMSNFRNAALARLVERDCIKLVTTERQNMSSRSLSTIPFRKIL